MMDPPRVRAGLLEGPPRVRAQPASFCVQLRLLLHKIWLTKVRSLRTSLAELVVPVIFFLAFNGPALTAPTLERPPDVLQVYNQVACVEGGNPVPSWP